MATTVKVKNSELIPAVEALTLTISWLKPGLLALRFSQLKSALMPLAQQVVTQRQALLMAHAMKETVDGVEKVQTQTVEFQGKQLEGTKIRDKEAFERDVNELMDAETEVSVPFLLTDAMFSVQWEKSVRDDIKLDTPDWSVLASFVDVDITA